MPPPTGVVSGPLMPTRSSRNASSVSSGSQLPDLVERLLPGEHFLPNDLPLAAVGLRDRRVEHALARPPDIGPGAVAFDERNDRPIRHRQAAVLHLNGLTDGDCCSSNRLLSMQSKESISRRGAEIAEPIQSIAPRPLRLCVRLLQRRQI